MADDIYAPLVAGVQLNEVILPALSEYLPDYGDGGCGLAYPGRPGEQKMRQVLGLDIGLETADDLILAGDVIQPLRPVLLDPDLLFYG